MVCSDLQSLPWKILIGRAIAPPAYRSSDSFLILAYLMRALLDSHPME